MKSAIINRWKSIDVVDVPVPELRENEALVRIIYCGICGSDIHVYLGKHPTAKLPIPLGHEMIGIVEKISGNLHAGISVGDRVVVHRDSCGKCDLCQTGASNQCQMVETWPRNIAGDSEYMIAHLQDLVRVPDNVSDMAGALTEPFSCAVRTMDRSGMKAGDRVLVIGGGTIGFAVALTAREMGASQVILSLKHQNRIELVREYGFEVIDAENEDAIQSVLKKTNGQGANITIEASGSSTGVEMSTFVTAVEGCIVMLAVGMDPWPPFDVGAIALKELRVVGSRAHTTADMRRAALLIGRLSEKYALEKLISDILPLDEIENGYQMMVHHKNAGKILVRVSE